MLLSIACARAAAAQQRGVFAALGAGAARVGSITGFAVNATILARTQWVQVVVTPIEFVSYSGGRAPYITRDIAGTDVCANSSLGPAGTRRSCIGTTAMYAASASVGFRVVGTPAFVGLGARSWSGRTAPYGTVAMDLGTWHAVPVNATAQVGSRYTSVMVSIGYQLQRRGHHPA